MMDHKSEPHHMTEITLNHQLQLVF